MSAKEFSFSLYRINIVDENTLYMLLHKHERIRNDQQIISVIQNSTVPEFDDRKEGRSSIHKWSLREFVDYGEIEGRGRIVSVVLARSILEKEGEIVTDDTIVKGRSASSPPLAETMILFFDLARHIVAVEYNSILLSSNQWKKSISNIFSRSKSSLMFSSTLQLEEIPEEHSVLELFFSFDQLTRMKVNLRIPNPELSRYTKRLYKTLQQGEIREYSQDMKNPNGLSREKDAIPYASASLAQGGYKEGDVIFEGYEKNNYVKKKSSEDAARGKINRLKDFVRGVSTTAKTKEAKVALVAILNEIDRIHPKEE